MFPIFASHAPCINVWYSAPLLFWLSSFAGSYWQHVGQYKYYCPYFGLYFMGSWRNLGINHSVRACWNAKE